MAQLVGAFRSYSAWWNYVTISLQRTETQAPHEEMYDLLEAYYLQNGVYEVLDRLNGSVGQVTSGDRINVSKPLRNPAKRVVEFYASKLWGGSLPNALPIETENDTIIPAIEKIWEWSNWGSEKQTCARWFANFGDMVIKVSTNGDVDKAPTRVFMQNIKPKYLTDFDVDERGYLTWGRFDVPRTRRNAKGDIEQYTHTEVWDKAANSYRVWHHEKGNRGGIDHMGQVRAEAEITDFGGINFIPIVVQSFRSYGTERGIGAFTTELDKIDEVNRMATRMHNMMYRHNKPLWATVRSASGTDGRPVPALNLGKDAPLTREDADEEIINMPGASDIKSLIPPINYEHFLATIDAQMMEIEKDLPELAYYRLRDLQLSGVAAITMLGDTIDKAIEARGNGEAGMIRAQQMALTMGQAYDLFDGVEGTFESGDFDHSFRERPVIATSEMDRANVFKSYVDAGSPPEYALRRAGASEDEVSDYQEDAKKQTKSDANLARELLNQAERQFDQGDA